MWQGEWEMNYWYTVKLCSSSKTLRHTELGVILKIRILTSESEKKNVEMKFTHFCAGDKIEDKMKGKPFTLSFFATRPTWSSCCVYMKCSTHSLHVWADAGMPQPLKQPVTDRSLQQHKPDLHLRLSHKHTGVKPASAYKAQLMLAWHCAQEVPLWVLSERLWACKPGISVLPAPLPVLGVRYPKAVSRSQKPDVLYSQTAIRDKLDNTCTRMPSMLLAFLDALQLWNFDFYSWPSTSSWVTETEAFLLIVSWSLEMAEDNSP